MDSGAHRVVVVGAGFGGLWAARVLASAPVEVLLVDRNNYHTFLPLAYQVAAAELSPDELVTPVRSILRKLPNVRFVMATVTRVDAERQVLICEDRIIPYNHLVLALGSTPDYSDIPGAEEYAFPLRTLEDGVALRNQILRCFEMASIERDVRARRRLLTFVIVGGGPTGMEFGGALAELIRRPLKRDFPNLDMRDVRLVVVEAKDSLLPGLPSHLGDYAKRLEGKGVEIRLKGVVSEINKGAVLLSGGELIPTDTAVWTAGHVGHPVAEASGLLINRQGQVIVKSTLQLGNHQNIYVVGDLAFVQQNGQPLPMVAPVAMQQGEHAGRNILMQIHGLKPTPFVYRDRGIMVVLGRNAAAARLGNRAFTGFPAWLLWLGVHLVRLIGFRNRLQILLQILLAWAWNYATFERHVHLILPATHREWRAGLRQTRRQDIAG